MSSWSKRRRLSYAIVVVILFAAAIVLPAYLIFYTPPTCFDGVMNGREQGTDCGGSCERLCASSFLPPDVTWTRFEEIAPGLYNLGAYIINPNIEGEAVNVPYHFLLYDEKGFLITEKTGKVTLPPHRTTLAFAPAVDVGKRVPTKALFEFTDSPDWRKKADPLSDLVIGDKDYTEDESGGSLLVKLRNSGLHPIPRIGVQTILYDASGNAIGFSKTIVDGIQPGEETVAPFTWPQGRQGRVVSIEVLPVAE